MENILSDNIFPDFIKIDAEGSDLQILKGSKKFLKTSLKIDTTKMKNFLLGMKDNAKNFYMTKLIPRYKVLQGKILYKTTGVKNTILEKIQKIKKSK